MKKLFIVFSVFIGLSSCKSNIKKSAGDTAAVVKHQKVSLLKKLLPLYQGVWVKSDYIDKIKQTKSVLASVDMVIGITGMEIDSSLITGDSLKVALGWDNQNPGEAVLRAKPGKHPASLQFGGDELAYAIAKQDTALILYQVYNNKLFTTRYKKILNVNANRNLSGAINYAINNALIEGDYFSNYGPNKVGKVSFTPDGQVVGLAGFKKYFIENDLKPGPLKNLDLIIFDEFSSKKALYSYRFAGNKLELYETTPNANGTRMVLGKLKYLLTRQ